MKMPTFVNNSAHAPLEYHRQARRWLREMRDTQPIVWDEEIKSWLLFRYEDIAHVQSDYHTFSSGPLEGRGGNLFEQDPPLHRQMRSLITQAFSAKMIAGMTLQIESIVRELLTPAILQDSFDWVTTLADPLPVMVMARVLGVPGEEWPQFKTWTDMIINQPGEQAQPVQRFAHFFAREMFKRRKRPGADLLSQLMSAEIEGERLAYDDLHTFCRMLFVAGSATTSRLLGNAMMCFIENPQEWERLRQQPELLSCAVEEILRYMSPHVPCPNSSVINLGRRAQKDVLFYGQLVRQGEQIHMSRLSANFDERHFSHPERFDIGRSPNHHQSFGHGIHYCVGAQLARLEISITLKYILQTLQKFQVTPGARVQQEPNMLVFGIQNLPLTFQRIYP